MKIKNNKEKFTKDILGELIITLDHFFEDNYNELEQYSKLYWNTYQLIKDQIEEMQFTKSSMQRLLEKYYNINFNEWLKNIKIINKLLKY